MKYDFISIEGNIGAGKTSLAKKLAEHLQARLILETFSDNPFLPKFFDKPERYAFPLELFFLAERYQQLKEVINKELFNNKVVSDYIGHKSILFARINLSKEEFALYKKLSDIINPPLPVPDILIYLHAPLEKLVANIKKRGRSYEKSISMKYLENLQEAYFNFLKQQNSYPVLLLDISDADFLGDNKSFQMLLELLKADYQKGIYRVKI